MERIKKNERQGVFFILLGRERMGGGKKRVWLRCGRKRKKKRERNREAVRRRERTRGHTKFVSTYSTPKYACLVKGREKE